MSNESLETCVYITSVRKRLQALEGIWMNRKIKKSQSSEKHLHSNKFMRTADRTTDVMSGFLNIKTERQLFRNNCLQRLSLGNE